MSLSTHAKHLLIPLHIAALGALYLGWNHPSYFWWTFFGWLLWGPIGVGIGFHRLLAHRSFSCASLYRRSLVAIGIMSGQGSPLSWVALHRFHHFHADTAEDLHSPKAGFWHSYILWQLVQNKTLSQVSLPFDLVREKWLLFVHKNYAKIFWITTAAMALVSWPMALFFIVLPAVIYTHQVNVVDTVCHSSAFGYRNFATSDNSRNHVVLGYLTLGVGFHNNHHADPGNWHFKKRWFEFDIGGYLIMLIKKKPAA